MKSKDMRIPLLLSYYGDALTDNQKDVLELYYNEDMSLAEIAEYEKISRQGVRDSIKRGETFMLELEEKLGLVKQIENLSETIGKMSAIADEIVEINNESYMSRAITEKGYELHDVAAKALEE